MSQTASDMAHIAGYYDRLVDSYGRDPRACDYGRPESQRIKFDVLSQVLDAPDLHMLDVGCGLADYAGFLQERWPGVRYTGLDVSPRMIEEGRAAHPELDLRLADVGQIAATEPFDVVNANGIFYLLPEPAWPRMQDLIRQMWQLAGSALAFTSLSTRASRHEAGEFYADPAATLRFCQTLTPWTVLRHDYLPHDFAIYMYRRQRPA